MTKRSFNLRNVVKIGVACLAVCMMFLGCGDKDKDKDKDGNGNGNLTGVALTLDLLKGKNDNEIIVKCTPACPWAKTAGFPACYFNQSGLASFYVATKTGGSATEIFSSPNDGGWNDAGTEYTYVFFCLGKDNWEGTVILAPVDKSIDNSGFGVKSITIGTNNPVPLKLGDWD